MLKRAFRGWLRGERDSLQNRRDPDPGRRRRQAAQRGAGLFGEGSGLVNRMKATCVRLGIRGFNTALKKAAEPPEALHTPEGEPIPPNTMAALRRDMERQRLLPEQIRQIEAARQERLQSAPEEGTHPMVRLLVNVSGSRLAGLFPLLINP
jgi:transposase